jgi:hypothetical protein
LLLGGGDEAKVVLGVLQVALGRDYVAGGLRIAGKLLLFFCDEGSRTPNLHIGTI